MKKFNQIDIITLLGITASLVLLLMAGCSMKFYKKSPDDIRQCCERVSAHTQEMEKFARYCKVAVFLANSQNTKAVGAGVRKSAEQAVNVCKFVFQVETNDQLISAGDAQGYYKVRSYIFTDPDLNGGWIHPDCDPAEIHCEEF
jgi:hypothetical protein